MRALVLLSGGLDSTVLVAHLLDHGEGVEALGIDYGQRHNRELTAAAAVAEHYGIRFDVLDLTALTRHLTGSALTDPTVPVPDGHYADVTMTSTVVPNRNATLLMAAVSVAVARGIPKVATAVHAGDHPIYPDCRPGAMHALASAAEECTDGACTIIAPFVSRSKTDVARVGARLSAPMHLTWSCYRGGDWHCGTCGTCTERREAFTDAGIPDPTTYQAVTA